ncbi:MAG: thioredoxin family protein, partial [Spirochaetales bacterium]|nr:thioredoxin family protein [Spirochaetales bacterium]
CVFFLFLSGCGKNKIGIESTQNDNSGDMNVKKTLIDSESVNTASQAIEYVKSTGQYLFLLFYETKDESFNSLKQNVNDFINKSDHNIFRFDASATDNSSKEIIQKYNIGTQKLPFLLVFTATGAPTGGFPGQVTDEQLENCFVSEFTERLLGVLQEEKIALVLLQNNSTQYNRESLKAAEYFSRDKGLKAKVEIIKKDPDNPSVKDFLVKIQLDKKINESTIVLLVPPGSVAGIFNGKTDKEALIGAIQKKNPSLVESSGADSTGNISPSKDPIDFNSLPKGIKVVFVEIGSVNCIPCKMMQPVMKKIEEEYGDQVKVVFYDVWTPAGRPYGQKYNTRVIPTQVFMDRSGKEISRHEGFYPKEELVKMLKEKGGVK